MSTLLLSSDTRRGHQIPWQMWLLGFELRTSRRAVTALNCWAISPAPDGFLETVRRGFFAESRHMVVFWKLSWETACNTLLKQTLEGVRCLGRVTPPWGDALVLVAVGLLHCCRWLTTNTQWLICLAKLGWSLLMMLLQAGLHWSLSWLYGEKQGRELLVFCLLLAASVDTC